MKNYPPASYITSIEIDKLFGDENVRLEVNSSNDPRILVMYGNNGTGKTTVLSIVRSLLSAEDDAGHRTRLANLPFSRAAIKLSGGVQVEAKKKDGARGAFDWSLSRSGVSESIHLNLKPRRGRISAEEWDPQQRHRYAMITSELRSLIPEIVYLDDKRTFYDQEEMFGKERIVERVLNDGRRIRTLIHDDSPDDDSDPVYFGLRDMVNSIRREALMLANRGNVDAQSIYTSLVKGVAAYPENKVDAKDVLAQKLQNLQKRSVAVSAYGLVASVDHADMLGVLNSASADRMEIMGAVISPYVESLSARLSAVETLHKEIDSWIVNINKFIAPKTINFKVGDGISIVSKFGEELPVNKLSSGERHLLMLMTRAFLMRTTGGLMIVDEPELSLNSAWQRKLIASILDAFGGGACQLLIASHSLEICSQYQNGLMRLN